MGRKLTDENRLSIVKPELIKEWHPTLNGDLTPHDVSVGSQQRVWWICEKMGHEWDTFVYNKKGCPQCANQKKMSFPEYVIYYYFRKIFRQTKSRYKLNIKIKHKFAEVDVYIPELNLAIEYDGSFHNSKPKQDLDRLKNKKLCESGVKVIRVRENTSMLFEDMNCHVIYNEYPNLEKLKMCLVEIGEIIQKHFNLDEITVEKLRALREVDINEDRVDIANTIEYCVLENSLSNVYPSLALEWDYEKNGKLRPENVTSKSGIPVWWVCDKNHSWLLSPHARTDTRSSTAEQFKPCPYCSGDRPTPEYCLASEYPHLVNEWDWEGNSDLTPFDILPFSNQSVAWKCVDKGHKWVAPVYWRTIGSNGCNECRCKPIECTYPDGKRISIRSIREASRVTGVPYHTIKGALERESGKIRRGFVFKYLDASNSQSNQTGVPDTQTTPPALCDDSVTLSPITTSGCLNSEPTASLNCSIAVSTEPDLSMTLRV